MTEEFNALLGELLAELTHVKTIEQTMSVLEEKAFPILKEFNIVKGKMHYYAPADIAFDNRVHDDWERIVSDQEPDTEDVFIKQYTTPNDGNVTFELFHAVGAKWIMEPQLNMLIDFVYIVLGRGRVYSSYDKANTTDGITGAYNRQALTRRVIQYQKTNIIQNYTAAFMNIKNFKWVNDKYGSGLGDLYLKEFSRIMMNFIKEDELFARMGGDNFVLLIRNESVDSTYDKLSHFNFTVIFKGEKVSFSPKVRVGIYSLKPGDGLHEMMQAITSAYHCARIPDNDDFVWFQSYMAEFDKKIRDIQDSFPGALKKREFVPYYQPKINLSTMTMCGAEALCRWKREDNFISPMEFIPTLEKDGTIVKLDFYMLDKVCEDIAGLMTKGLNPGKVSINFSKHHIHDKSLSRRIIDIINKRGVDHSNIEIELTEMYEYDDYNDVHQFISAMAEAGIAVSLDDFGTGYSSLNMLTGLDANIVKLDKSFMDDIETKPERHGSMVKNIIGMISELGMETIAEGVETKEQCELLKKWNCDSVQGYLFDKPLPLEEFEKRILNPVYDMEA